MTHSSIRPPKLATLLLGLFASEPDFPQIEGDLSEEFHDRLRTSGPNRANRWYWREALRNIWALSKRPRVMQVFLLAALSMFVYRFAVASTFQWLRFMLSSAPRVPGLQLVLLFVFSTAVAGALGALMSRCVRERAHMLRLTFSALFLLMVTYRGVTIGYHDIRFLLYPINSASILIAFWMGSLWVSRNGLRNQTA